LRLCRTCSKKHSGAQQCKHHFHAAPSFFFPLHHQPGLDHRLGELLDVSRLDGDGITEPLPWLDLHVLFDPLAAGIGERRNRGHSAVVGDAEVRPRGMGVVWLMGLGMRHKKTLLR